MANENWSYVEKCMNEHGSRIYFLVRIAEKGEYEIWRMLNGEAGNRIVMEDNDSAVFAIKPVPWDQIATIKYIDTPGMVRIARSLLKVNHEMLAKTAVFFASSQAKIDQVLTS